MSQQFKRISICGEGFDAEVTIKNPEVLKDIEYALYDETPENKNAKLQMVFSDFVSGVGNVFSFLARERDLLVGLETPKVYLCGPMEFAGDGGVGWRKTFTDLVGGFMFVEDPCVVEADIDEACLETTQSQLSATKTHKDLTGLSKIMDPIQDRDFEAVDSADILVVGLDHKSGPGGTYCELQHAFETGKEIHGILLSELEAENSWILNTIIRAGGKIFYSVQEASEFFRSIYA